MEEGWSSGMSRVRRAALQGVILVRYQSMSEMRKCPYRSNAVCQNQPNAGLGPE